MKQCGKKFLVTGLILSLILSLCPLSLSASTTKAAEDKGIVLIYGRIEGSQHWTKDNIYYILTDGSLISPVIIGDLPSIRELLFAWAREIQATAR